MMSGVPMPDRLRASHSTGGKLAGTLKMVASTPASASSSQKAVPWRRFAHLAAAAGNLPAPELARTASAPLASLAAEEGQQGLGVAVDEIEDAVAARIHAR